MNNYIGMSPDLGKIQIQTWILNNFPIRSKILDVGAGGGIYSDLLSPYGYQLDAIEAFTPTIPLIMSKYQTIYNIEIQKFIFNQNYDLVIMGDVLEHLSVKEAQKAIKNILTHTKWLLVAVPFLWPQDDRGQNPYEIHLQPDLTEKIMFERYPQLSPLLIIQDSESYVIIKDEINGDIPFVHKRSRRTKGKICIPQTVTYAYYIAKGELDE